MENKKNKLPGWAIFLIVLGAIIVFVVPVGLVTFATFITYEEAKLLKIQETESNYTFSGGDLLIEKSNITSYYDKIDNEDVYVLKGYIKNIGDEAYEYINLEFVFHDVNRVVLGDGIGYVRRIEPGETSKFEVVYYGNDYMEVSTYKPIGVNFNYWY